MALPVDRNTWQTDFSSLNRRYVPVVDNNGRRFLVDTRTKRRWPAGGQGQWAGIQAIWGQAVEGVFLTGYEERESVQALYGGPNAIEQVVAGLREDPLTGQVNPNPQAITTVSGIPYDPSPDPQAEPAPERQPRNFLEELRAQYPFYPDGFLKAWADEWQDTGDSNLALANVRQRPQYEQWFPGNRRDDGSLAYSEEMYAQTKRGYQQVLKEFGIPPSEFDRKVGDLIAGEVSAGEFADRVARTYTEVLSRGNDIKQWYADNFGTGRLSDASILASALDGETSPTIFEQRFRTAQIGGEFARTGFDLTLAEATRLAEFGLGQEAARTFAQDARVQLPVLQALAQRHNDPDDDLDLSEFLDAEIFQDPEQMQRLERLFVQETSSFTPTSGTFARDRQGGTPGLTPR